MFALWQLTQGDVASFAAPIWTSLQRHRPGQAATSEIAGWQAAFLRESDIHVSSRPDAQATPVILFGHIDGSDRLRRDLSLPPDSTAADIYAHAHARYDGATESRLSGNYCAVAIDPQGGLRIARSAWDAPPLYVFQRSGLCIVSPLVRLLQAAGAPTEPTPDRLRDALAFDFHEVDDTTIYPGIVRLPLGCSAHLDGEGLRYEYRYDPGTITIAPIADRDAVERASRLLATAVGEALEDCRDPAIALSGGLDSGLVAAHAARHAGPRRLHTLTVRPHRLWRDGARGDSCDDEWPTAAAFAACHDALIAHVVDDDDSDFDQLAREIFASSRLFTPGLANIGMFAPLWRQAARLGCDTILTADLGNQGFSASGNWAYAADLRRLALGRFAANVLGQPDNAARGRVLRQRVLSPLLPGSAKSVMRRLRRKPDDLTLASMLRPDVLEAMRRDRPSKASAWDQGWQHMSRADIARFDHRVCDRGAADMLLALREIHGLRHRDATAYRPLIEFCLSLPDDQFLRHGQERFLARRMAEGLMPEAQRLRPAMARHNVDWRERIGRRSDELAVYAGAMRGHPTLAGLVDLERLETLLRDWPDRGDSHAEFMSGWFGVTSAILAGRFLGAIGNRNDL